MATTSRQLLQLYCTSGAQPPANPLDLIAAEEINDLGDPQDVNQNPDGTVREAVLPSTSPPAYSLHAPPIVIKQPVAMTSDVHMRVPWYDESEIKAIRNEAITSVALSTALSLCLYPLFCSLPAFIFGILALCNLRKDTSSAKMYAKVSLGLMIAAAILITALFTVAVVCAISA